jgi:hypothetical protein
MANKVIAQRREVKLGKNPGKIISRKKSAATGECVAALYTNQKPK